MADRNQKNLNSVYRSHTHPWRDRNVHRPFSGVGDSGGGGGYTSGDVEEAGGGYYGEPFPRGYFGETYYGEREDWMSSGQTGGSEEWRRYGPYRSRRRWRSTTPEVTDRAEAVPGPYSGRGPSGYQRPDDFIQEEACYRLTQHGQVDAKDVQVEVQHGEITLKGLVPNRGMKRLAEDAVDSIAGVKDVHNELRVLREGQK